MSPAELRIMVDPSDPNRVKVYLGAGYWLSLTREHERWRSEEYRLAMMGGALAVPKDEAPERWPEL